VSVLNRLAVKMACMQSRDSVSGAEAVESSTQRIGLCRRTDAARQSSHRAVVKAVQMSQVTL